MKKNIKVMMSIITAILVITISSPVFASNQYYSKAETLSKLTNKSIETILETKNKLNVTFGEIAKENGVLSEFQKANLEQKEQILNDRVNKGLITKEQADDILDRIKENQKNCDGTGNNGDGLGLGLGSNNKNSGGNGSGNGSNANNGGHHGQGKSSGQLKFQGGSCYQ